MPGDQSWVTRVSREDSPDWVSWKLLEQAGRPPAGTDYSRGTRDWVSSNWAPVVWIPSSPRNQGGRVMGHNFSYGTDGPAWDGGELGTSVTPGDGLGDQSLQTG